MEGRGSRGLLSPCPWTCRAVAAAAAAALTSESRLLKPVRFLRETRWITFKPIPAQRHRHSMEDFNGGVQFSEQGLSE